MNKKPLSSVIKSILWGYVMICLHINIGNVDIFPNWIGYFIIVGALPALSQKESSAILLKPLGIVLALWSIFEWIYNIVGGTLEAYVINVIVGVLSIYFHFQLITNIAAFASSPKRKKRLIMLRSVTVVFHTATIVFVAAPYISAVVIATALVQAVMCIWTCVELHSLSSSIKNEEKLASQSAAQADLLIDKCDEEKNY